MKYKLFNLAGTLLGHTEAEDATAAIQWLFSNFPTRPGADDIALVGQRGGRQQYSVGPFDLIVEEVND